jgi:Secretion system C-terminal sorting domain/Bacterial pre-peptidase C-terminal domain
MKSFLFFIAFLFPVIVFAQNECEPNNSFVQACPVALANNSSTISGKINPKYDVDFFKITIPRSGVITAKVTNVPSTVRMKVTLFYENETPISGQTTQNTGTNINYEQLVPAAGTYYLKVEDDYSIYHYGYSTEPYDLTIGLDTTDVYEWNQDFLSAAPINYETSNLVGTIRSKGDVDFFKITIPRSGVITAKVINVPSTVRMKVTLFYENQAPVSGQAAQNTGTNVNYEQLVPTAGTYYLKVEDDYSIYHDGYSTQPYDLTIGLDTTDVYEWNQEFGSAAPINFGTSNLTGTIRSKGDIDFFKITIPRSGFFTTKVLNVPTSVRMKVSLFNEDQTFISGQAAQNTGTNINYEQLICQEGTYYLKLEDDYSIYHDGYSTQPYSLSIGLDTSDVYECNNTILEARTISSCDTLFASFRDKNDVDFYKFSVASSGLIKCKVTNVPTNIDVELRLYDADQVELPNYYATNGDGMSLIYQPTTPINAGTYYIRLNDRYNNASNNSLYRFTMNFDCTTTDVNEVISKEIKIFPNPTTETLHIDMFSDLFSNEYRYEIRNILGKIVQNEVIINTIEAIDVSNLPQGSYIIELKGEGWSTVRQFIKI